MQAMILAAGFGTRLLPHTLIKPKPLFPLLNIPLLLLVIHRLQAIGFDHILVNCHHLSEQITEILEDIPFVTVQKEEIILGTGGGLRGILKKLRNEPLFVTNCDIYHTIDIKQFYNNHVDSSHSITLATHDYPRFNSVNVDGNQVVGFDRGSDTSLLAFTGLHMVHPELLESIVENEYSCIIDHYCKLLSENIFISSYRVDNCFWTDMGTPEEYLKLNEGLLAGTIPRWQEIEEPTSTFCITQNSKIHESAELHGWACIKDAYLGKNVHLSNSVVWENVSIPDGRTIANMIISSSDNI